MKEDSVFTPGFLWFGDVGEIESRGADSGAGGGSGHADAAGVEVEDGFEVKIFPVCGSGAVAPGTAALWRRVEILSLYASFSLLMSPL